LIKKDFLSKDSLLRQNKNGLKRKLIAFKMLDKGIPRTDSEIVHNNNVIGKVTSGTFSPTLEIGIGFGYVLNRIAEERSEISIRIRDKDFPAEMVNTPFVTKSRKR